MAAQQQAHRAASRQIQQPPNVEAVVFFLSMLDMDADYLREFTNRLRRMKDWPDGVSPAHLAETLDSVLDGHVGYISGARLAARGEDF